MSNSLGPTLASWFLGMIEKEIFCQHFSFYPSFYVRYLDDVLTIFNSSTNVRLFLNVLNNHYLNLRFTREEASSPSLPFLDIKLSICDGEFNVSVYRKPAVTGVLLHFNSITPLFGKQGFVACLSHLFQSDHFVLSTNFLFKFNVSLPLVTGELLQNTVDVNNVTYKLYNIKLQRLPVLLNTKNYLFIM